MIGRRLRRLLGSAPGTRRGGARSSHLAAPATSARTSLTAKANSARPLSRDTRRREALAARVELPGPVACERVSVTNGTARLPFASVLGPAALAQAASDDPNPLRREWARRLLADSASGLPDGAVCEIQVLALSPGVAWALAGEMVVDFARALSGPPIQL